jgi:hypothetical protein
MPLHTTLDLLSLPDDEVIYLYDADDDYFGYAINLQWPDGSEWGYCYVEKQSAKI